MSASASTYAMHAHAHRQQQDEEIVAPLLESGRARTLDRGGGNNSNSSGSGGNSNSSNNAFAVTIGPISSSSSSSTASAAGASSSSSSTASYSKYDKTDALGRWIPVARAWWSTRALVSVLAFFALAALVVLVWRSQHSGYRLVTPAPSLPDDMGPPITEWMPEDAAAAAAPVRGGADADAGADVGASDDDSATPASSLRRTRRKRRERRTNRPAERLAERVRHPADDLANQEEQGAREVEPEQAAPQSPPQPSPPSPPQQDADAEIWRSHAQSVKDAFLWAYTPYETHCFGQDEYHPLSKSCNNWIGAGLTIVDALPTMQIMGLTEQTTRASAWVRDSLRFESNMMTSFFETTIRVLGGLVSMYDLTHEEHMLSKAKDLGQRLAAAFDTPTGLPLAQINLQSSMAMPLSWTGGSSLLAEVGTCQMEFFALSHHLNDDSLARKAQRPVDLLDESHPRIPGLYPIYIDPNSGAFTNDKIAWGAMGDSFYEYLLKMYLLTGKQHEQYRTMYIESVDAMIQHLFQHTASGTAYIADMNGGSLDRKMDHLVCFVPGMLALGVKHEVVTGERAEKYMSVARELMDTCNLMYTSQVSGIGAEYSRFDGEITPGHDASYKLRPETVESLFVMWRVTGEQKYRDWGWRIFERINEHCRVPGGFAALSDVRSPALKEDRMESFFLAETLKYLYLLFSDNDLIPIFPSGTSSEFFVFTTECHPIRAWATWP